MCFSKILHIPGFLFLKSNRNAPALPSRRNIPCQKGFCDLNWQHKKILYFRLKDSLRLSNLVKVENSWAERHFQSPAGVLSHNELVFFRLQCKAAGLKLRMLMFNRSSLKSPSKIASGLCCNHKILGTGNTREGLFHDFCLRFLFLPLFLTTMTGQVSWRGMNFSLRLFLS